MEQGAQGTGSARTRIVRTEEQILSILEEFDGSGYTAKEFCEVSDINEATFYSWQKKYRTKPEGEEPRGFAAIELTPAKQERPQLFAEIGGIKLYREVSAEYLKSFLS
jgi:Transposase